MMTGQINKSIVDARKNNKLIVGVHTYGSKPPVFCTSSMLWYKHIVPYIDKEQPFYCFEPSASTKMEDIVARYIAEIQEVQPEGPYTVVGYCQSAYIAYEIAAKLEAMGHRNNNVIIIESSTPWYEEDIRKTQSYNLILDKYKLILIKRPLKLVRESLGQERGGRLKFITSKIAYVLGTRVKKIAGMPGNAPVYTLTGYDQIRFPNHSFSNFTGKIVIIKASIQPPLDKYDQYLGWTKIVPPQNIEMHIVNGTHKSIFFPPFVHELGEVLNRNFNN